MRPARELALGDCNPAHRFSWRAQCKKGAVRVSTGLGNKKRSVRFRLFVYGAYLSERRKGLYPGQLLTMMYPADIMRA